MFSIQWMKYMRVSYERNICMPGCLHLFRDHLSFRTCLVTCHMREIYACRDAYTYFGITFLSGPALLLGLSNLHFISKGKTSVAGVWLVWFKPQFGLLFLWLSQWFYLKTYLIFPTSFNSLRPYELGVGLGLLVRTSLFHNYWWTLEFANAFLSPGVN
jgi:hypothetical protein